MRRRLSWYSEGLYSDEKATAGILFLPGRGGSGLHMLGFYKRVFELKDVALMCLTPTPIEFGWYPMPNGAHDQSYACEGLKNASKALDDVLANIETKFDLPREKIVVIGFSAGAVVGTHHFTHFERPCAAMVSHSGAILEPDDLPQAGHSHPIILNHSQDDTCFEWHERYLPMKQALIRNGYKVKLAERARGDHVMSYQDVERLKPILESSLNITLKHASWINPDFDPDFDPDLDPDLDPDPVEN